VSPEPLYSLPLALTVDVDFLISSRASNLPNFVVWIEIDGQAAPVYSKTESEDHKTVICYIESEEGKQFKVCFADLRQSSPQDPYSVQAYVDGN